MSIQIPGYRILEEVASGGSGTVYRAVQEGLGREVAVKVLAAGLFAAADVKARFLREARLQAKLSHPNLVALFDAGFVSLRPYLVAEFIAGGTLGALIDRRGALELPEVAGLGTGIAAGLAYAHDAGIVHRDLKPGNVLIGENCLAKIADFGLAKSQERPGTLRTASGIVMGTPGYIAPEAIRGEPATPAADVYALGVLLFEMAAGRSLFEGRDAGRILQAQLDADPQSIARLSGENLRGLRSLVCDCLDLDPRQRPSATQVEARLKNLTSAEALPATQQSPVLRDEKAAAGSRARKQARTAPVSAAPSKRPPPPGPATRWGALAVTVVTVAFAIAAWLVRAPALPPAEEPAPATVKKPSSPAVPAKASPAEALIGSLSRLPVEDWSASGADRIHFFWGSPAPAGLHLRLHRSRSTWAKMLEVSAGQSDFVVADLEPATAYELELTGGAASRKDRLATLARLGNTGPVVLCGSTPGNSSLSMASVDDRVAVAWCKDTADRREYVLLRESQDGGLSWGPMRALCEPCSRVRNVSMVARDSDWLVAWLVQSGRESQAELRSLPFDAASRAVSATLTCVLPGPVLLTAVGAAPECYTAERAEAGQLALRRRQLGRGTGLVPGGSVVSRAPAPWLRRLVLAGQGSRRFLVASVADTMGEPSPVLRYTVGNTASESAWPPLKGLDLSGNSASYVVAFAGPQALTVACVFDKPLLKFVSLDGGESFRQSSLPVEETLYSGCPATASRAETLILGNVEFAAGDPVERIMTSADGQHWDSRGNVPLSPGSYLGTRLVCVRERLLLCIVSMNDGLLLKALPLPR